MARGSAWTVGFRWSLRLLGLVSTVILARLLTPADYGIVAMAMLIVGTVETFSRTGQYNAIVRHPNPTREHYDSAWTVSLLLGLFLGVIIVAATPLTISYFKEPRAAAVVMVLALRTVLSGAQNIGVVNFQRDLQFHKRFWFTVYPSLISFVITIVAAFVLRNYWALVIGIMTQQVATIVLSYVMEPFRPHFSFAKVREIWSFSIWTWIRAIGVYLNDVVDRIAIGGFGGAAVMGRYDVAQDLAGSPTQELINPMVAVLFPVMATVQDDGAKRRQLYLQVLYWSALICTSTAIGVALVANDMVDLVLGAKWQDVKPLMPWLALAFGVLGLSSGVYSAYDVVGRPEVSARLQWTRLAGLALCIFPVAFLLHDPRAIAITRLLVTIAITPTLLLALTRLLDISMRDLLATLWRPSTAGAFMTAVVLGINAALPFVGPGRLFIDVAAGAASYAGALMVLWLLSGRPAGPEDVVWNWGLRLRRRPAPQATPLAEPTSPLSDKTG